MLYDGQTSSFPGAGGYAATHKGVDREGHMTPNFEIMEGQRFGPFYPAPYLPIVREEKAWQDFIVIGAGKAVACDSNGWLVPAGLKLVLAAGDGNGPQYTQLDIDLGIKNALGNTPTVGQYVGDLMTDASVTVGHCAGALSYNAYLLSGSDPTNPATYRFHNYNRQSGVAVLTDYLLEFPVEPLKRTAHTMATEVIATPLADPYTLDLDHDTVVASTVVVTVNGDQVHADDITFNVGAGMGGVDQLEFSATLRASLEDDDELVVSYLFEEAFYAAPFTGMATWKGSAKPGDKVTYDIDSNWLTYAPGTISDTSTGNRAAQIQAVVAATLEIVGQVCWVDTSYPKQFLDRVKTAFDPRLSGTIVDGETGLELPLNRHPGSATDGMPHNIVFAGGDAATGTVRFNLNVT